LGRSSLSATLPGPGLIGALLPHGRPFGPRMAQKRDFKSGRGALNTNGEVPRQALPGGTEDAILSPIWALARRA
jgi:hypothetical protein